MQSILVCKFSLIKKILFKICYIIHMHHERNSTIIYNIALKFFQTMFVNKLCSNFIFDAVIINLNEVIFIAIGK